MTATSERAGGRAVSRRAVLAASGGTLATALAGCSGDGVEHGWLSVGSPTSAALYDAAVTTAGPHAVGEGGTVVARTDEDWTTIVADGPAGAGNTLYGVDLTDGGQRLWFAGASGAVGAYDAVAEELTDYSAPDERTSSWADVAVAGRGGSERVALVNTSGEFLLGRTTPDGVRWGGAAKPTGGESASAVDVAGRTVLVADTGGGVYARRPATGGEDAAWETIGIDGTDVEIADLVAVDGDTVSVVTDGGTVYAYDGHRWLETPVAEGSLRGIARHAATGVAVGDGGGVYDLDGHEWQSAETPTEATLYGCALDTGSYSDVVVGERGTILERFG